MARCIALITFSVLAFALASAVFAFASAVLAFASSKFSSLLTKLAPDNRAYLGRDCAEQWELLDKRAKLLHEL